MCVCCARMFVHCVCLVCVGVRGCMFGQTAWAECKWMFSSKFDIDDKLRGNLGQLFREIDQDGSGFLDRAEVEQLSKRLGKLMTERELAASMTAMGADADGQVSLEGFVAWWRKSKAGDGGAGDGEEDSGAFAAVMEQAEYMELLADATEEDARELCEEAGISPVPATLEGMVAALKQQHQRQDKTLIYQRSDGSSSDHTGVEEVHVLVAAGGITDATYVWYEGLETWSQWSSCKVGFDGSFDEHADAHDDDDDDDEATAATAVSDVGPGPGGADDAADTAASSDGTSPEPRRDEQNREKEQQQQQQRVERLFREIDQDGSGFLDRAEVEQLSKRLGKLMTERELAASMTAMGADADGQVSLEGFVAWWRKSKAGDGGAGDGEEDSGAFAAVMEQAEYMELLADATEEDARELCEEAGISPVPATLEGMVAALKQQHQRQDKTLIYQRSDGSSSDHTGVEEVHVLVAAGGITDATYVWYEGLETWSQWSSCKVGFDGSFDEHADAHDDDDDDDEATAATAVSDVGPGPGGADDAADTAASSDGTSPVRRHDEQNQEKEKEQQQQQKQQQQQHENVSAVSDTDTAGGSLADHTDASEDDQYSGPSRTSSIELLARNSLVSQRLSRFGEPVDEAKTLAPVDLQVPRHLLLPHERSDLSIEHAATVSALGSMETSDVHVNVDESADEQKAVDVIVAKLRAGKTSIEHAATVSALGSMETSDVHVNVDESADEQKAVDVIVAKLRAGKTSKAGNAETAQLDKSQHDCTSPIEDGRVDQGEEQSTAAVLPRPSAVSNQDRCCVLETAAGLTTIQTGLFPRIAMLEASVFGASLDEKAQQSLGLARRLEDLEAELM